jgi:hypothetical protein
MAALSLTTAYPWGATVFEDAQISNAWVADSTYTGGGGTVSTWTAQKGATSLSAVASPTWAANWGTGNKGCTTLNGTTQYYTGNGVASGVSGLRKPWYQAFAVKHVAIGTKQLASLDHSSTGSFGFHTCTTQVTTNKLLCTRIGDSGISSTPTATTQTIATATNNVIEWWYDGQNVTIRLNGVLTSCNGVAQDTVAATLDQYTVGCFRGGGTAANFTNATYRAVVANFGVLPDSVARDVVAGYLLGEAA